MFACYKHSLLLLNGALNPQYNCFQLSSTQNSKA